MRETVREKASMKLQRQDRSGFESSSRKWTMMAEVIEGFVTRERAATTGPAQRGRALHYTSKKADSPKARQA